MRCNHCTGPSCEQFRSRCGRSLGAGCARSACLPANAVARSARAARTIEPLAKTPFLTSAPVPALPPARARSLRAWPQTQRWVRESRRLHCTHIIATKRGNLKVLQWPTALLRLHCDLATTLVRTISVASAAFSAHGCRSFARDIKESRAQTNMRHGGGIVWDRARRSASRSPVR